VKPTRRQIFVLGFRVRAVYVHARDSKFTKGLQDDFLAGVPPTPKL
jgi:hypothetical protein